jgi:outer membrane protein
MHPHLNARFVLLLALLLSGLIHPGVGRAQAAVANQAAPLEITLRQALRLALENNPGLQQAANQVETDAIALAQRRADFAPDLKATLAGVERFDKALEPDGGSDHRNYETATGALSSTVNLFNGFGDVAALRGAEWGLAGQQDNFTREEQTLIFSTVSAFLQSLSDRELIRVRTENLEGNRRQLEQIEALHQAGNRPVSDLYQQPAETSSAELELLLAERNYAVSLFLLLQTIGLSPATAATLAAPPLETLEMALAAQPPENAEGAALTQRADLTAREKQIEVAREQLAAAQSGYWPTLDLATSIGSDYSSLYRAAGFSDQFFDDNPKANIGLTLSIPIFDRQQTRNQVALARIRQSDARLSLLQQQLQAETELGQALQDFGTAQKLIGVTTAQLTAARQALDAVEERYRVGAATLVELTQSRTQFVQAGFERVKARYGLIKQGAAVAYYQGNWTRMQTLLVQWESPK